MDFQFCFVFSSYSSLASILEGIWFCGMNWRVRKSLFRLFVQIPPMSHHTFLYSRYNSWTFLGRFLSSPCTYKIFSNHSAYIVLLGFWFMNTIIFYLATKNVNKNVIFFPRFFVTCLNHKVYIYIYIYIF